MIVVVEARTPEHRCRPGWLALSLFVHLGLVLILLLWPASPRTIERAHSIELLAAPAATLASGALGGLSPLVDRFGDPDGPLLGDAVSRAESRLPVPRRQALVRPRPSPAARGTDEPTPLLDGAPGAWRGGSPPLLRAEAADALAEGAEKPAGGAVSRGASRERLSRIGKDGTAPFDGSRWLVSGEIVASGRAIGGLVGEGLGLGLGRGRRGIGWGSEQGSEHWLTSPDQRYTDYFRRIYHKVHPLWSFPKQLELLLEQGDVLVQFTVVADGNVEDIRLRKSSGHDQFDKNVMAAIRQAAPFGPIPRGLGDRLKILAPFEFSNPIVR